MMHIWNMRGTLVDKFLWLPAGVTMVQIARNTDGRKTQVACEVVVMIFSGYD